MNSPADSQLEAVCPYCRGKIPLPTDPEAKTAKCPRCSEKVPLVLLEAHLGHSPRVISQASTANPSPTGSAPDAQPRPKPPPPAPPTEVRVKCRLCGTIIYAPLSKIGQKVKCPDCDSMNVVPEPPKAEKKVEVKLDEVDSFHLLDGIDQPDRMSASSQQKWYMAKCPTCFSQLRLTVDHVGKRIKCPDCHSEFVGPEPPPPGEQKNRVVEDDEYELRLSEPVERPPVDVDDLIQSTQVVLGRELQAASSRGDLDSREKLQSLHTLVKGEKQPPADGSPSAEKPQTRQGGQKPGPAAAEASEVHEIDDEAYLDEGKPPEEPWEQQPADGQESDEREAAEKPAPARRPWYKLSAQSMFFKKLMLSGLRTCCQDSGVIFRWVLMAVFLTLTLYMGALAAEVFQVRVRGNAAAGAAMLVYSIAIAILLLISLITVANTFLPIVIAAGLELDQVDDWPPFSPGDMFFQMFYLINAVALGAMPTVIFIPFASVPVLLVMQWLLIVPIFPIAVLSMLDEGSPFAPYAPGLWRLLLVYKGLWWRFTVVGYAMAGLGMLLASLVIVSGSFLLAILAGVVLASLIVVYARFVGRMAMFMSEQSSPQESLAEYDD